MSSHPRGVKLEVYRNVLTCSDCKTVEENLERIRQAISTLWGYEVTWENLENVGYKVSLYTEKGQIKI